MITIFLIISLVLNWVLFSIICCLYVMWKDEQDIVNRIGKWFNVNKKNRQEFRNAVVFEATEVSIEKLYYMQQRLTPDYPGLQWRGLIVS